MGRKLCCLDSGSTRLLDDEQEGPRTQDTRSCTDCLCLLLFSECKWDSHSQPSELHAPAAPTDAYRQS